MVDSESSGHSQSETAAVKRPKFWTFTGRYAFSTKKAALRFMEAIEELDELVAGEVVAGSGYVVQQAMRPPYHVIEFRHNGWTIQHPIDCDVFACRMPGAAGRLTGPPSELGRFRADLRPNGSLNVGLRLL